MIITSQSSVGRSTSRPPLHSQNQKQLNFIEKSLESKSFIDNKGPSMMIQQKKMSHYLNQNFTSNQMMDGRDQSKTLAKGKTTRLRMLRPLTHKNSLSSESTSVEKTTGQTNCKNQNWTFFALNQNKENYCVPPQQSGTYELESQFSIEDALHFKYNDSSKQKKANFKAILPSMVAQKLSNTAETPQSVRNSTKESQLQFNENTDRNLSGNSSTQEEEAKYSINTPITGKKDVLVRPSSSNRKIMPPLASDAKRKQSSPKQTPQNNKDADPLKSVDSDSSEEDSEENKNHQSLRQDASKAPQNRTQSHQRNSLKSQASSSLVKYSSNMMPQIKQSESLREKKLNYGMNNEVTFKTMKLRKHLDLGRWYCITRPQYKKSCGISSVVACFNYLFSRLSGNAINQHRDVLTQERALEILGFKEPYNEIVFGSFTGNKRVMKWFIQLCQEFGVQGKAKIMYKPKGSKNRTQHLTSKDAFAFLQDGLQNSNKAYIYHCFNHYMVPVGFELLPNSPTEAYKYPMGSYEPWVLVADNSRKHQTFHCIKWSDIDRDLNMENPQYLDIRNLFKGVQTKDSSNKGKNSHCIIEFSSVNKIGVQSYRM